MSEIVSLQLGVETSLSFMTIGAIEPN